jgi:hypothetical protein
LEIKKPPPAWALSVGRRVSRNNAVFKKKASNDTEIYESDAAGNILNLNIPKTGSVSVNLDQTVYVRLRDIL